jgi:hypothetical protein
LKKSGAIVAGKHLGSVVIVGSVTGNSTASVLISAVAIDDVPSGGTDFAIDRITVGGAVSYANILAGFNENGVPDNADASIGPVIIGGSWSFSNLVAGAQDAGAPGWGVGDVLQTVDNNAAQIARIAGITILGKVESSDAGIYGFVSQQIDFLKIGAKKVQLNAGPSNDPSKLLPGLTNVYVEEVA